jgi:hypothetical protein
MESASFGCPVSIRVKLREVLAITVGDCNAFLKFNLFSKLPFVFLAAREEGADDSICGACFFFTQEKQLPEIFI